MIFFVDLWVVRSLSKAKYFFLGESGFVVFRFLNLRMAFVFCSVFLCVCVCVLDPLFLWLPGQSCAGWSVVFCCWLVTLVIVPIHSLNYKYTYTSFIGINVKR